MADRLLEVIATLKREREAFTQQAAMFRSGTLRVYANEKQIPPEDSARDADRLAKEMEGLITRVEEVTYGEAQTVFEVLQ